MDEDIRIELFTTRDLRLWIEHNQSSRGLSEKIVSKTRAWSWIHNPYAGDDTPLLAVIFVNDEVAAYDSAFPEQMARPNRLVYWNSMLYVAPQFEGRGYGAIVIGSLLEQYGGILYDHAAAPASIENFRFLGMSVAYVPQYIFGYKHIHTDSFKGWIANLRNKMDMQRIRRNWKRCRKSLQSPFYRLEYVRYVDDELYDFISVHSKQDIWLRTKESFNWMMQYPFDMDAPLSELVVRSNQFASELALYRTWCVKVFFENQLIGFYILRQRGEEMVVRYLYFDTENQLLVFDSIIEHLLKSEPKSFVTYVQPLADRLKAFNLYQHCNIYPTSFTFPTDFQYDSHLNIQAGDGDMFS